jgi:hypothetical protein
MYVLFADPDLSLCIAKIGVDFVKSFSLIHSANRFAHQNIPGLCLVDDPISPSALLYLHEGMLMALGHEVAYPAMFEDLLQGRVEAPDMWPPRSLQKAVCSQIEQEGFAGLFLNTVPVSAYDAALQAGFAAHPHDHGSPPAFLYSFTGNARFADRVQHPCRLAQGVELLDLLKQGISYDEGGYYTTLCLRNGPSFVCEVDGQPVCWSCTHLNGTMGMIYTPEQHRRKGYAGSLAAFQIDHMLATSQFACCHIVEGNTASEDLVLGMGARRDDLAYCWRSVVWPEANLPAVIG